MANETGGLILIHYHDNKDVIDLFTALNGKLCWDGKVVFPIDDPDLLNKLKDLDGVLQYDDKPVMIPVKQTSENALKVTPERELFVDGSYFLNQEEYNVLTKFQYGAYILTWNGQEVGLRASEESVKNTINYVWQNIDNDPNYAWLKDAQEPEEDAT